MPREFIILDKFPQHIQFRVFVTFNDTDREKLCFAKVLLNSAQGMVLGQIKHSAFSAED